MVKTILPHFQRTRRHQGETCHYCGARVFVVGTPEALANPSSVKTRDHYVPQCRGVRENNIVTACHQCNYVKGDSAPEVFEYFMRWRKPKPIGEMRKEYNSFLYELARFGLVAAIERHKWQERQKAAANDRAPVIIEQRRDARGRFTKRDLRRGAA